MVIGLVPRFRSFYASLFRLMPLKKMKEKKKKKDLDAYRTKLKTICLVLSASQSHLSACVYVCVCVCVWLVTEVIFLITRALVYPGYANSSKCETINQEK